MKKIWFPFSQEAVEGERINIVRGKDEFLWDESGKRYVDLISSWWVNIHGHCNEYIVEKINEQAQNLDHVMFSDFGHNQAVDFSAKLDRETNGNFAKFFYSDNGSTATEVAIKIAKQYFINTGFKEKSKIISFKGGYHGDTLGSMSIGRESGFFGHFKDWMPDFEFISYPSTFDNDDLRDEKEQNSLNELEAVIKKNGDKICAIIIEPLMQGAAGMKMSSINFMNKVVEICKNHGILVIFDEVMTGFHRTGKMFAYQHLSHSPDILCLSKGITGGVLPLAVTCVKGFIYEAFVSILMDKTFLHGHSYTANPIAMAAANASMDLFEANDYSLNISNISNVYSDFQEELKTRKYAKEFRTMGSIFAFSVDGNDSYGSTLSRELKAEFLRSGLNVRPIGSNIYILPPYSIDLSVLKNSCQTILEILDKFFINKN
jgi:adenosylmethionine-8-amino-7-oxononanoate aminotransferase